MHILTQPHVQVAYIMQAIQKRTWCKNWKLHQAYYTWHSTCKNSYYREYNTVNVKWVHSCKTNAGMTLDKSTYMYVEASLNCCSSLVPERQSTNWNGIMPEKKILKKLMFLDQIYTFRLHFSDNSQRHMYFTTGIGLAISSTQRTI